MADAAASDEEGIFAAASDERMGTLMPAFVQKLNTSNPNSICGAAAAVVGRQPMRQVLNQWLAVPMFQRRYCWGPSQWNTLLTDVERMADLRETPKIPHWLGRLTCTATKGNQTSINERTKVIDGQQRCTSTLLLLAAVRDCLASKLKTPKEHNATHRSCIRNMIEELNHILLPDMDLFNQWVEARERDCPISIAEGEVLSFARLVPTYCDRASFYTAILPVEVGARTDVEWTRPMEAKRWFISKMQDRSVEEVHHFLNAMLDRVDMLMFPVTVGSGASDSLEIIYERLAVRDATFCRPHRKGEFADMGAADFVRNLLLGSFENEDTAIHLYQQLWLPLEKSAAEISDRLRASVSSVLEDMLKGFLEQYKLEEVPAPNPSPSKWAGPIVGGTIYSNFRTWVVSKTGPTTWIYNGPSVPAIKANELWTVELLNRLLAYGKNRFHENNQLSAIDTASCVE